jgi:hypothetical protein
MTIVTHESRGSEALRAKILRAMVHQVVVRLLYSVFACRLVVVKATKIGTTTGIHSCTYITLKKRPKVAEALLVVMNPPTLLSKQGQDDESACIVERATASHLGSSVEQILIPSANIVEKKGSSIVDHSEDRDDEDDSESDMEIASPKKKRRSRKAEDVPMSFPQKVSPGSRWNVETIRRSHI